jgi:radical SAM superfamily enzyme YgiQ (UPF0313 family)
MRLLLINPKFDESFWSFRFAIDNIFVKEKAINPPLGLATVAALTPSNWQVNIVDENIEPIPLNPDADIIGVCGMMVQFRRQKEILTYYRNKGYTAVAGGSGASLCPEMYENIADVIVSGESEYIWKEFCSDFENGNYKKLYKETGTVDMADVPVPRFDLLKMDRYKTASIQFSIGCPFDCEFCDIIVMFGRKPRNKLTDQIGKELDALRESGITNIFFVDDNFIGNRKKAIILLNYLIEYQRKNKIRFSFGTEVSLNLANDDVLLDLLRKANFDWVFIGIESVNKKSLEEANKTQNQSINELEAVRKIYSYGIEVFAGFIVGFDNDDISVFKELEDFIIKSGIQVSMVGLLYAPPKTPLYLRMKNENRIKEDSGYYENTQLGTNVIPKGMSYEEMLENYKKLYLKLCTNRNIYKKIVNKYKYFNKETSEVEKTDKEVVKNLLLKGIMKGGISRIFYFLMTLLKVKSKYYHLVGSDWVSGISMMEYAKNNFEKSVHHDLLKNIISDIKKRTNKYIKKGVLNIKVDLSPDNPTDNQTGNPTGNPTKIIIHLKGNLKNRIYNFLQLNIKEILNKGNAYLIIHIDGTFKNYSKVKNFVYSLGDYRDKITIQINSSLDSILDLDFTNFNIKLN